MSAQEPVKAPDDLRQKVAEHKAVVLVGAGISAGATGGNPLATWYGLLEDGVHFCEKRIGGIPDGWAERVRADIRSGDLDDLLVAAEKLTRKLGTSANLLEWLRGSVGRLEPAARDTIEAIAALNLPIMTTNYDRLLEEVTAQPSVDWQEDDRVQRVLTGDEPGIIHVHGWYERPQSVVLDIRSYERALASGFMQTALHSVAFMNSILFIGFGSGLDDPNFSRFREWIRDVLSKLTNRHYRLCRTKDLARLTDEHKEDSFLRVLSFGAEYDDLATYLRSLRSVGPGLSAAAPGLSAELSSAQDRPPVAGVADARNASPAGDVGRRARPLTTVAAGPLLRESPSAITADSAAIQQALQQIAPQLLEAIRHMEQAS